MSKLDSLSDLLRTVDAGRDKAIKCPLCKRSYRFIRTHLRKKHAEVVLYGSVAK